MIFSVKQKSRTVIVSPFAGPSMLVITGGIRSGKGVGVAVGRGVGVLVGCGGGVQVGLGVGVLVGPGVGVLVGPGVAVSVGRVVGAKKLLTILGVGDSSGDSVGLCCLFGTMITGDELFGLDVLFPATSL